ASSSGRTRLNRACREAGSEGWNHRKKVGPRVEWGPAFSIGASKRVSDADIDATNGKYGALAIVTDECGARG
ncbi:hypothetical protein AAHH78_36110, partial [Burkholderia pseudomallei]